MREMRVSSGACVTGWAQLLSCVGGGCCRCRSSGVEEGHEFGCWREEFLLLMFQFLKELVLCCGEKSSMVGVLHHAVLVWWRHGACGGKDCGQYAGEKGVTLIGAFDCAEAAIAANLSSHHRAFRWW